MGHHFSYSLPTCKEESRKRVSFPGSSAVPSCSFLASCIFFLTYHPLYRVTFFVPFQVRGWEVRKGASRKLFHQQVMFNCEISADQQNCCGREMSQEPWNTCQNFARCQPAKSQHWGNAILGWGWGELVSLMYGIFCNCYPQHIIKYNLISQYSKRVKP